MPIKVTLSLCERPVFPFVQVCFGVLGSFLRFFPFPSLPQSQTFKPSAVRGILEENISLLLVLHVLIYLTSILRSSNPSGTDPRRSESRVRIEYQTEYLHRMWHHDKPRKTTFAQSGLRQMEIISNLRFNSLPPFVALQFLKGVCFVQRAEYK